MALNYGWVVVFGCCICNFVMVGLSRSLGIYYYVFLEKFGESAAATAIFLSIYNTLRMVLGPVASTLCVHFGCRIVVMLGGLIFSLGFLISCFATNVLFLNISFGVVCGVGGSFIYTPPYIIVGEYFDKQRGRAMSLSTIGAGFGSIALAPLVSFLLHQYGSFGALLVTSALVLHICVGGALFRPKVKPKLEVIVSTPALRQKRLEKFKAEQAELFSSLDRISVTSERAKGNEELWSSKLNYSDDEINSNHGVQRPESDVKVITKTPEKEHKPGVLPAMKRKVEMLTNVTYLIYLLNISAMPFVLMTPMIYLPSLAVEIGASTDMASLLLSLLGLADIVGRFLFGFIFDFKAIRDKKRRRLMFGIIGITFGILTALLGFCNSFLLLAIITFLYGILEGGFHSQRMTVLGEFLTPQQIADGVGWSIFAQGAGNLVSTPLSGYLKDYYGTFRVGYFFGGAMFCVVSCLLILDYAIRTACTKKK